MPAVPAVIQTQIDTFYTTNLESQIAAWQATYLAANGKYWQGLVTHTTYPQDGNTASPDNLSSKPFYEALNWLQVGYPAPNAVPLPTPMQTQVHQYVTPTGTCGYQVVLRWQASIGSVIYERSIDYGVEPWRTQAWHIYNSNG